MTKRPQFRLTARRAAASVPSNSAIYRTGTVMEQPTYRGPSRAAHGQMYWALIGWWWEPLKWLGRMSAWVLFFPVGIWRSARHGRKTREARERRGYR